MRKKNKKFLLLLINKLVDGSITKQERDGLFRFFINNQKIDSWPKEFSSAETIERKIFNKIKLELDDKSYKKSHKTIPFFKKKLFKYGIAASFLILVALTFFMNHNDKLNEQPIIVNNNIEIGTDKATLTLENGTVIPLVKGQKYISSNLESTGEGLVYKSTNSNNTSEVLYNYLTIPRGGQFHVILSDGTEVWLNSETQLKYPVAFVEGETRKVELVYGEAYFEVSPSTEHHGMRFKVYHKEQDIEVLGTEFNVKAYKDETNIVTTLVHGKVNVNRRGDLYVLKPNEQSILNLTTNKITLNEIDVYYETSWRSGVFAFKEKSFAEIMKVMSRWYDMDVVFKDKSLEKKNFRGVLGKEQNIEEIMLAIKNSSSIKNYEINNKTIIIE
ncbi:FecR family protein [Mariniflexile sp. HMF6888]|uniref:FecR family protein n=1 Tax=Mariniflexile sp. HMF6888 TaxID=3373086 RepID=UPI00378BC53D